MAFNKNKTKRSVKNKNRRTDVKLVIINEEELIQQVCIRPTIYDRSLKGYRKMSIRKQCWNDISKAMNSTEEECRKRWRSLRDSFAKNYKAAQRSNDVTNKQCKWVFYDQMSFLIPHLDGVSYDFDKILDEFGDISEDGQSLNSEPAVLNSVNEVLEQNNQAIENTKEQKEHNQSLQQPSTVSVQATNFMSIPVANTLQSPMLTNDNENSGRTSTGFTSHNHTCTNHNTSTNTACGETIGDSGALDSDEKFLLSCAPTLRRLTNRQNALARLKIQQILFDVEFEQKNI